MVVQWLLIIATTVFVYAFYKWATLNDDYFKHRGVKYLKPKFLVGNTGILLFERLAAVQIAKKLYDFFPEEPIYGAFMCRTPVYFLRDPNVIKRIGISDFDHFENHKIVTEVSTDKIWGRNLAMLEGQKWRDMRAALSPMFSGSKMRQMFDLVCDCADDYVQFFLEEAKNGKKINIEMKETFARYSNDVIATCSFGLKINSLRDPKNHFFEAGKKMMDLSRVCVLIRLVVLNKLPALAKALKIQLLDKKEENLFSSIILRALSKRKNNNVQRPDMINLLMQVREGNLKHQIDESNESYDGFATAQEFDIGTKSVNRKWNDNEIVSQCLIFFLAGFETISTTLTMASYEITANPDIQQKLYEEIVKTSEEIDGKRITYDALQKMKYLDQVVCEVLRLWPPTVLTNRQCNKDYAYDDGRLKFIIEKGTELGILIFGVQRDPNHFPDPEKFDPERFNDKNKKNIVAGSYIPFGVGPRNCIAARFALMELKAILYYLLLNFSFEVNEKTDIPIKFAANPFNLQTKNGMNIELRPRTH